MSRSFLYPVVDLNRKTFKQAGAFGNMSKLRDAWIDFNANRFTFFNRILSVHFLATIGCSGQHYLKKEHDNKEAETHDGKKLRLLIWAVLKFYER